MKNLSQDELKQLDQPEQDEIRQYLQNVVMETLWRNKDIHEDELMSMRWVVTVKHFPVKKIKARLIMLRYQAGDFEDELLEAATPTPTRRTKHCFLQVAAHHCFELKKADVSGAFLQGRERQANRYVVPVNELADALGITRRKPARLRKTGYGLVIAPKELVESVCDGWKEMDLVQCKTDPCAWKLVKETSQGSFLCELVGCGLALLQLHLQIIRVKFRFCVDARFFTQFCFRIVNAPSIFPLLRTYEQEFLDEHILVLAVLQGDGSDRFVKFHSHDSDCTTPYTDVVSVAPNFLLHWQLYSPAG